MKIDFENMVLFEDNHLLIINKPANLLSQEDNTKDHDVINLAKKYLKEKYNKPGNVYVGLVHRLDRMTEGVMVLAKTSKCASRLSEDIRNKYWNKKYLALVKGIIDNDSRLTDYIEHIDNTKKMQIVNVGKGQKAELEYKVLDHINGNTLLLINLITGRHHQIRVQFAGFNHPLIGDTLYGNPKDKQDLMLACYQIEFKHPTLDKKIIIKDLPKSKKWIKVLENVKSIHL